MGCKDHLILIDGSAFLFRAYHALPPLTRRSDGLPVGAVAGFCSMLWKLMRGTSDALPDGFDQATHRAIIFDAPGKTFRSDLYPAYKANRGAPPEDLVAQFRLVRAAAAAFGFPCLERVGYEADDLIATYAQRAADRGAHVLLVASDKDLMQLIGPRIAMYDGMKACLIDREKVIEKFGVEPEKTPDVQALAGDSSDNVPGVPGIGVKTAARLVRALGCLESVLARTDEIKQPGLRKKLITFADQARLSLQLVTLDRNVPMETPFEALFVKETDFVPIIAFLKAMECETLVRRFAKEAGIDPLPILPDSRFIAFQEKIDIGGERTGEKGNHSNDSDRSASGSPEMLIELFRKERAPVPVNPGKILLIRELDTLRSWIEEAFEKGVVAIGASTKFSDPMDAHLTAIALAMAQGRLCHVPFAPPHETKRTASSLLPLDDALSLLGPLFEAESVLKVGHGLRQVVVLFMRHGFKVRSVDDTMLMSHALDSGRCRHGLKDLAALELGSSFALFEENLSSKREEISEEEWAVCTGMKAAEKADIALRLYKRLKQRLISERAYTAYETLGRPMIGTLARMEIAGVRIDRKVLFSLSERFEREKASLEEALENLAGVSFNPGSPAQVAEILFGKMGLPGAKKTKGGAWATGASILETFAARGHLFSSKLLRWRELAKLTSTYTDALLEHINPETGRVHSLYDAASVITGRLSSSRPNVQNIPARKSDGRSIRAAFIAEPGCKLVSADYNQIELRVLAHMADAPALKEAFLRGLDIHAMTAAELFGLRVEDVDPLSRRRAKVINFSILYGVSAFGLAERLALSRADAGQYISEYFRRFPGVRDHIEETKAFCRAHGFVRTAFGRKIHYPGITSRNARVRAEIERAAVNAPIQGSAADIVRRAMARVDAALEEAGTGARMLMQVHDELVFEVPEPHLESMILLIKRTMEQAAEPALHWKIPLTVDTQAADDWAGAH